MFKQFLLAIVLFASIVSAPAQETCSSSSLKPYEWPSHRNFVVATNANNGYLINTLSGGISGYSGSDNIRAYEGTTTISDDDGNFLFFANGRSLYDATGTIIYGGLLTGNEGAQAQGSAAQGVMAVRHPLNPTQYYIITTDDALTAATNGMNYAVVNSDGTMAQGSTQLGSFRTTEGVTATWHKNGVDIWVTVVQAKSTNILSYLLKCDGFDTTPVVSPVGIATVSRSNERGGIAFSWDSEKFAGGFHPTSGANKVRLYDFDNSTGILTFDKGIGSGVVHPYASYGVTFSPDNSRVLASSSWGHVFSLDIATGVGTSLIANSGWPGAIEIGADGSLYIGGLSGTATRKLSGNLNNGSSLTVTSLATIGSLGQNTMFLPPAEEPDIEETGPYCNTDVAIDLSTNWICSGLDAEDPGEVPLAYRGAGITDRANGIFDPAVAGEGTHEIIFEYCGVDDTIWVVVNNCILCDAKLNDIEPEICVGTTYTLDDLVNKASANGVWTIDSMPTGISPVITIGTDTVFDGSNLAVTDGTYKLLYTVNDGLEVCYDSVYIVVNPLPEPDLGDDKEICLGAVAVIFDAGNYASYVWQSNLEISQTISTYVAGEYTVKVTDVHGCEGNDTVILTVNPLPTPDLGVDTAICIGDAPVNFDAGTYSSYLWQPNSEINQTISKDLEDEYILTVTNVYGCKANDTVVLTVNSLPTPDLGADTAICTGDIPVTFDAGTYSSYLWQPNSETSQTISTDVDGEYIVTIIDANGCENTDKVVLTLYANPIVDLGPDSVICEDEPSVVFGTGIFDRYAWLPNNEVVQTISTDVTGTYELIVFDAHGCSDTDEVILTVNTLPITNLGSDIEICDGELGVNFDAGSFNSYLWTPNSEITQTITTNVDGDYAVEVTDVNGCKYSDTINLKVNDLPVIDLGSDVTICPGSSVTLDATSNLATYIWNGEKMTQTIDVTDSNEGVFNVLVTDTNGCSTKDTVEVIVAEHLYVNLSSDTAFCDGNTLSVNAGIIAGVTYAWQPTGESTQVIDITTSGTYSVQVIDTMECSVKDTIIVTVNLNPTVDLGSDVTVCPGFDSLFTVGPGWSSVTWNDASITDDLIVNTAGTYYVDVTDINECSATDTAEFNFFAGATVDLGSDITICPGTTTSFDAGIFASHTWQDATGDQTYVVDVASVVYVDVVDFDGCIASDTAEIFMATSLPVDLGNDTTICEGETVTISSGYPSLGYTFLWNTGETTNEIKKLTAGIYSVLVQDLTGCLGDDTTNLVINLLPVVDLGVDKVICEGESDSFVAGTGWSTIIWNTLETNQVIDVDSTANYMVRVTDNNGCEASDEALLTVNTNPIVNLGNDQTVCLGSTALFDAGTYLGYVWQDGTATNFYSSSTQEKVHVTVTDVNGCIGSDTAEILVRNALLVDLGSDLDTCAGNTIDLLSGYSATYNTLVWSTKETTENITVHTSGTYFVDVTDANDCAGNDTVEITVHINPIVDLGDDQSICDGDTATFDAGVFTSYLWSDASVNQTINRWNSGAYSLVVTDVNECTGTDEVYLIINDNPTVSIGNNVEVCPGNEVTFSTIPNGFKSYVWQDQSTESSFTTLDPQEVSVLVIDVNGCTAVDKTELTNLPSLAVVLPVDQTLCEGENVEITVPGFDSNTYTFLWSNGSTSSSITVGTADSYSVFVSNDGGCAGYDAIDVTVNLNPIPVVNDTRACEGEVATMTTGNYVSYLWSSRDITQTINVTREGIYTVTVVDTNNCIGAGSAVFSVHAKPTIPPYEDQEACEGDSITLSPLLPVGTYLWRPNGENTAAVDVIKEGVYEVVVTNDTGCKDSINVSASFNTIPVIDLGLDVVICEAETARIGYQSGSGTIAWSIGVVSDSLETAEAGEFVATITDVNGCMNQDVIEVRVSSNPMPLASSDTAVCMQEIGELALNVDVSLRDEVIWSTGESSNEIIINTEGTYYVTAINGAGCIGKDTIVVDRKCISEIFVPNAFTPDNDGINDGFGPQGINITNLDFYVFNRWGEQIFHSISMDDKWDGKVNGNIVPVDVYIWKIFYRTEEDYGGLKSRQKVGTVTVLR